MPAGRPLKFKSVKELQIKIDAYFKSCYIDYIDEETQQTLTKNIRPLTITGLALDLDTSRETLLDYQDKEEYSDAIKKAKERILQYAEESLFTNKNVAGIIFNMKNNWKWADRQEVTSENINHNLNSDVSAMSKEDLEAELLDLEKK